MSGIRKSFFFYKVTIAACLKSLSFQQIFSPKKMRCIVFFCFFCYLKGGNKAASIACTRDFVDKDVLDEMIKALKIKRLNGQKLRLKNTTNFTTQSTV